MQKNIFLWNENEIKMEHEIENYFWILWNGNIIKYVILMEFRIYLGILF